MQPGSQASPSNSITKGSDFGPLGELHCRISVHPLVLDPPRNSLLFPGGEGVEQMGRARQLENWWQDCCSVSARNGQ